MRFDHVVKSSGRRGRLVRLAVLLLAGGIAGGMLSTRPRAARTDDAAEVRAILEQHCFVCHGAAAAKAGLNLDRISAAASVGEHFQEWERVALVLEQKTMPPKSMPQPGEAERARVIAWVRGALAAYAKAHDGDPGRVTVRRLTSGEYAYAIQDLTGLELDLGIDAATDSVGGEGFTNFGDVQFMQDANLERYLAAAKKVADHAVIGAGPLEFFPDPGKTGFELAAIARIREIYAANGFRTVSGEGGRPFGLEKYGKALYVAWQHRHRAALGKAGATLRQLAEGEGISLRFAQHISDVMNRPGLGYPLSEAASRWRGLPAPGDKAAMAAARAGCDEIQKFLVTWPSWLFARGDLAAGGAGDESPLEFTDRTLNVKPTHKFAFIRGGVRGGNFPPGPAKIYLNVNSVNPATPGKPVIIWRGMTVGMRPRAARPQTLALAEGKTGQTGQTGGQGQAAATQPTPEQLKARLATTPSGEFFLRSASSKSSRTRLARSGSGCRLSEVVVETFDNGPP